MDTQTFLSDLARLAKSSNRSPENSNEFFDYLDVHFKDYTDATPEERTEIRKFIKGKLFQPRYISHELLMYVKQRVLQKLKSSGDELWVRRGLVAISMDDFSGKFDDPEYVAYPFMQGDALFLLADLYVTAEECGFDSEPIFNEIAEISNPQPTKYVSMKEMLGKAGKTQFAYERREHGKFVGMF